jgi:prevent-host-death family protein
METLQIREAKASFSALVAAAEKGRPTLVSRHGQPCAMIVPVADGARLYPLDMPNLANYLLTLPEPFDADTRGDFVTVRDSTPLRGVDFE